MLRLTNKDNVTQDVAEDNSLWIDRKRRGCKSSNCICLTGGLEQGGSNEKNADDDDP